MYHNGKALEFTDTVKATENAVTFASEGDVVLMARASQKGGSPKLRVSVNGTFTAPAQAITNSGAPQPYTFDVNAPSGSVQIGVKAANTGTGRQPYLDYAASPQRWWHGGKGTGGRHDLAEFDKTGGGARGWVRDTSGSTQALAVMDGKLVIGGHFYAVADQAGDGCGGAPRGRRPEGQS
jgi:hypothetical protein